MWKSFQLTSLTLEIHIYPYQYCFLWHLEELPALQRNDFDHFKDFVQIFMNELQHLELRTHDRMSLNFGEMYFPKLETLTLIYQVRVDAESMLNDVKFVKMKNFPKLKTLTRRQLGESDIEVLDFEHV